jgi:hypothetical protein
MAIPTTGLCVLSAVLLVLWKTNGWSNGALGSGVLGLVAITVVVGELMAPRSPEERYRRGR